MLSGHPGYCIVSYELSKQCRKQLYEICSYSDVIPIIIKICDIVISTGGLRSSLKWRDLANNRSAVKSRI